MRLSKDFSLSALAAGFVTVLVGFTSSAVVVLQAAHALGASPAQVASWMWALGLGMGVTCIALSLRYRMPVLTAWSTPGAAMLISSTGGGSLEEATGGFVVSALLLTAAGFSGLFERVMDRIPTAIASGMLAGVLLRFGLQLFSGMQTQLALVLTMVLAYLVARRLAPRYAVMVALVAGAGVAGALGLLRFEGVHLELARPEWVRPRFTVAGLVGIAVPLALVTMASQNAPGVAVMRGAGFALPLSPVLGWTGVANVLLAPFGAFALNLAAITAAICSGREAHEDPARRYVAAVAAGVFYLAVGLVGATVGALFAAFPAELVLALAGLALLGPIGAGLAGAMAQERDREAALVTFLVAASGLTLLGIGSAFWGLVAGTLTWALLRAPLPLGPRTRTR